MEFDSLSVGLGSATPVTPQVYSGTKTQPEQGSSSGGSNAAVRPVAGGEYTPKIDTTVQESAPQVAKAREVKTEVDLSREHERKVEKQINEDEVRKAVNEANKQLRSSFREFSYNFHKKTNTLMIKVLNSATKETIREIPAEKSLDALAKMWELTGIIVDEKK